VGGGGAGGKVREMVGLQGGCGRLWGWWDGAGSGGVGMGGCGRWWRSTLIRTGGTPAPDVTLGQCGRSPHRAAWRVPGDGPRLCDDPGGN